MVTVIPWTYSIYTTADELNHLREKHPCLLDQAMSYGAEMTPATGGCHLYDLMKTVMINLVDAWNEMKEG